MRLTPSYRRGLVVALIGTSLALSHIAFAAAAPATGRTTLAPTAALAGGRTVLAQTDTVGQRAGAATSLAENCYIEKEVERLADGRLVTRLVHECD
ncbi:MAG TPA: hypothetical protein VIL09_03165 [Microvirga sp.]|jgi:hypothetical protein